MIKNYYLIIYTVYAIRDEEHNCAFSDVFTFSTPVERTYYHKSS